MRAATTTCRAAQFALLPLASAALHWLAFYPGVIGDDAITSYATALRGGLADWHPYPYAALLLAIVAPLRSFGLLTALTAIAAATVVGSLAARLERAGASRRAVWSAIVFVSIAPVFPLFAINAWKDAAFAFAVLWIASELVAFAVDEKVSRANDVRLALASSIVTLFRHPGILTFAIVIAGAAWALPRRRARILMTAATVVVIWFVVRVPLFAMWNVEPAPPQQTQWIVFHHIGAAVTSDVPIGEHDRRAVDRLLPPEAWRESYRCTEGSRLQMDRRIDHAFWEQHPEVVRGLWWRLVAANPGVLARHLACATRYLWLPAKFVYAVPWSFEGGVGRTVIPNDLGVEPRPIVGALNRLLSPWIAATLDSRVLMALLWSPATYLYVVLIACVVAFRRHRSSLDRLIALPAIATVIPFIPLAASAHVRYVAPILLYAPFAIALAARSRASRSESTSTLGPSTR